MREQLENKSNQCEVYGDFAKELESLNRFQSDSPELLLTFSVGCDAFLSIFCCG